MTMFMYLLHHIFTYLENTHIIPEVVFYHVM